MIVQAGQTQTLTATLLNDSANKGVTWVVSGAGCSGASLRITLGSVERIRKSCEFHGTDQRAKSRSVTVTATSVGDGTKSGAASITILPRQHLSQ